LTLWTATEIYERENQNIQETAQGIYEVVEGIWRYESEMTGVIRTFKFLDNLPSPFKLQRVCSVEEKTLNGE
jgi:hypothetical protein